MAKKPGWQPGDPLPENELWTIVMVAQFAKRSTRTIRRRGIPQVPGEPGRYDPKVVRAWFTEEFQNVGVYRRARDRASRDPSHREV
jgi:hypothetical protein